MAGLNFQDVHIEHAVLESSFNDGDALAAAAPPLRGKLCKEIRTRGDGACSVHAVFGEANATTQSLVCPRARTILRSILDKPLVRIRPSVRAHKQHLVDNVAGGLWSEFVVPHVNADGTVCRMAPNEEQLS